MSLGTSLFLIAIGVLIFLSIKLINKHKKWRTVGKVSGIIILFILIISLSIWGWFLYKDRPQVQYSLGSLSLGMSVVEVTLAAGEPTTTSFNGVRRFYYNDNYSNRLKYLVSFSDINEEPEEKVDIICTREYLNDVFGLSVYSSEEQIKKKLGEPSYQSIRSDGFAKIISYEELNVSFEIEKKNVVMVCISTSGKTTYSEEYFLKE